MNITARYYVGVIAIIAAFAGCYLPCTTQAQSLFQKDGLPTQQLKDLFVQLGHPITTLQEANDFAQQHLLRIGERWDKQEGTPVQLLMKQHEIELMQGLTALGMVKEVKPTQKTYRYALLMGALKSRVVTRLDYMVDLMQRGYTFDTIVLLGGDRDLRDVEREGLPAEVTNEALMMEYVVKQRPELRRHRILLVNAPKIKKADGTIARPTTDSTVEYFAKIAPKKGSCLVLSNAPYTMRQTLATQHILEPHGFTVDGAGSAFSSSVDIVMLMDEFARTLYEVYKHARHSHVTAKSQL